MRARLTAVLFILIAFLTVGVVLTRIVEKRHEYARVNCLNNLRLHGQAPAAVFELAGKLVANLTDDKKQDVFIPGDIPAGTVFVAGRPPEDRLSWIAATLGGMSQTGQDTITLAGKLDLAEKWNAGRNADVGRTSLNLFTCPGNIPDQPGMNQYVGLSGLGTDSATLGVNGPISPRTGCFRYDSPTPLNLLYHNQRLDTALLFAEVSLDLGPWIRGGPSSVRGLDDSPTALPGIGFGGQFGGNHPNGVAAVGYASGAAQFVTAKMDPAVLRAIITISRQTALPGGD